MPTSSTFVSNNVKPLILVDGSSYLYRAFHALPPLTNSKGQPTGAIYGVINMLRKLLNDYVPEYMAVVFDSKEKTFRDDLYSAYKANRATMPDELRQQVAPLHQLIKAMGIPLLIIDGVEADDVIGTLAQQASAQQLSVIISTGDKDFAQLVNQHITLVNTMSNTVLDVQGVENKFGVHPEQIIDYLSLIGDTSDNIPGIPSVGPKTAAKWLKEYGTLDVLLANLASIKNKVGDNLRAHLDQLPLTKQLVTIKCDIPLSVTIQELQLKSNDIELLAQYFENLEFKSWLADLGKGEKPNRTKKIKRYYITITDETQLEELFNELKHASLFAVDTETTSLNAIDAAIVGLSFALQKDKAYYIPVAHHYPGVPAQLDRKRVLAKLKPILEDPQIHKIAHHVKYDRNVLLNHDINLQGVAYDTMLESYILDSTATRHDMDSLALKYLGKKTILFEDVAGKGVKQLTFDQVPIEQASEYAAEDSEVTFQLHQTLWPKLQQQPGLKKTFIEIEMPLAIVLADMERYGVLIDANLLNKQSQELAQRILELEQQAYKEAGTVFNLASPKQLQEILFGKMQIPALEKTPSGQPSTAEAVLQDLAHDYPFVKIILEHRTLCKLKSTYSDKLPEQINPKTGRVHTSYQQAVAATGRLSSTNPNLQNIPIRTNEGRRIRQAFIAPAGSKIIAADYSQIELRIMAHLSQDKSLLQAFAHNLDIHSATAAEIFNVELSQVTSEQRRRAKATNFGLIYGMSAFGLAKQLGVGRNIAQQYIDTYFARYPGVKNYMETTRKLAHEQGYVTTLFGRQLYLPEINARNIQRQRAAERAAINAPLQGTAADIIKIAMIHLANWLEKSKISARMIMQVHDELVFEVANHAIDEACSQIKTIMEEAMSLDAPLMVDIGIGENWDEAH